MGAFASPNRAGVMNSLPAGDRGAGGGMNSTFKNSAQVLSIGIFFSLMIAGLSAALPQTMAAGLIAHGVPAAAAHRSPTCRRSRSCSRPSSATTRSQHLLGPSVLAALPAASVRLLTGRSPSSRA